MEKYNTRKGKLQRLIIDIDNLKVNPVSDDLQNFYLNDQLIINDELKKVIKISKNEYLDLEYVFIKNI